MKNSAFLLAAGILLIPCASWSKPVVGRYVRCSVNSWNGILTLNEVEVFERGVNVATNGAASQSSTECGGVASRAVDGRIGELYSEGTMTHTKHNAGFDRPWWELDLKCDRKIEAINVWNRPDFHGRMNRLRVQVLDGNRIVRWSGYVEKAKRTKNAFIVKEGQGGKDVGLPFVHTRMHEDLKEQFKNSPDRVRETRQERVKWFDPVAFKRAVNAYADKHREIYPDRSAFL